MKQRTKTKRIVYIGIPAILVLLIGAMLVTYFWQMRFQKPLEINMAHHHMAADMKGMESMEDMEDMEGMVSCSSLIAPDNNAPVRRFDLTAAQTTLEMDNGKKMKAWTFNGSSPGPELRVTEGDRVVVKLHNKDIEDGVTIHWHGIPVPCSQDGIAGVSQDAVQPGEQFTYTFIADHPGTYWYHSHQMSSIQVDKGLLGMIIVDPKVKSTNQTDVPVIYQELNKKLILNGSTHGLTVPGKPGEKIRLRLTNAGNETMKFVIDGAAYQIIAMDGQDLHEPGWLEGTTLSIGGGQRYDLLIPIPESGMVVVSSPSAKNLPIRIGSGQEPAHTEDGEPFSFVNYGSPLVNDPVLKITPNRRFELKLGQALFVKSINGNAFHDIPPMIVKEGDDVLIKLTNEGGGDHPFHLHGHIFRVMSRNGILLQGSPVYLDTLLTHKGESYELYVKADNPGLWMAHCHNLQHASMGMSMMFNYENVETPYRVGTKSGNLPDL